MLQAITRRLKRFKRSRRGISTVIVVMLSLVLIMVIVGNVVLWSYQMNQLDWEKMQERIDIVSTQSFNENWTQNPVAYALGGSTSWVSGGILDLAADDEVYMTFRSYNSGTGTVDFVDNNLSDVDSSADIGTHSDFTAQQYGPDSIYDMLTEENIGVYNSTVMSFSPDYRWELDGDETDSVDAAHSDGGNDPSWVANIIPYGESQCGDYDGVSDETLIPNQADINSANTYEKSISVWVEVDTIDTSGNGRVIWGEGGASRGLALYVLDVGGEDRLYAVVYEDSGTTSDYCYTTISTGTLYHIGLTLDAPAGELILYVDGIEVASDTSLAIGTTFGAHSGGIAIGGVDANLYNHNVATLNGYFDGRIADVVYYAEQTVLGEEDFASIYAAGIGDDYELDLEVQWTDVDFDEANEELCIYGGAMGSESLRVDVWNGSSWQNVIASLNSGWNNVSVSSYLDSSTFTIRFKGGTETGDGVQDSWGIDVALLRVGVSEYTSEVEFTGLSNVEEWTQLDWTTNIGWTIGTVNVTLQLYNFTLDGYPTSGDGYVAYTSDSSPDVDENRSQTVNTNPTDFRNATGYWKIKIKGTKTGATQFDLKVDLIEFRETTLGTLVTFENGGSLTSHLVSLWINNSTSHQRYEMNSFIAPGETTSYFGKNVILPVGSYTLKVSTERGNAAVFSES